MALSPMQQRNLENRLKCKVIDRTALILEISRTCEYPCSRLQVELALYVPTLTPCALMDSP